jgi:S-adenosyl-L-methionine hydrolase (adenosine-forming)
MARRFDTISFLSDLGTADEAVGVIKAVVRDLASHAVVIDLTHHIPAYDVRAGSLALARAIGYVPSGVVLASVDAGVAATRPLVAIQVANGEGVLVGPDNGVLAPAVAMAGGAERAVLLTDPRFHLASAGGPFATRDVLAPVAAHLCNGIDLAELGDAVDADALLPGVVPLPREAPGGGVIAEVLWVDRLGNCQLNIGVDDVAPWGDTSGTRVQIAATDLVRVAERVEHASTLGVGSVGLQVDPYGMLALALDRRSAAEELSLGVGDQVTLSPLAEGDRGPGTTSPVTLRPHR